MADELRIPLDPFTQTGLTLLGKVYNNTGSQEGSTVPMTEDGPALYIGDFALGAVGDGEYVVRFETNTPDKLYGTGSLFVRNNAEVSQQSFFNGALDTVANVSIVATTTTNTDMRGTDSAITSLVGIATTTNVTDAQATIIAEIDANETKIDGVKAKTDQLVFTAGAVDSNVEALAQSEITKIVNQTLDEVIDNSNHTVPKSLAKRIRQAGTSLATEGTVSDGSPTASSFISDLIQTESSFYADQTLIFISGTLEGQARIVASYNGTTKVITFDEAFSVAPSNGDEFEIKADHIHPVSQIQAGLALESKQDTVQTSIDNLNDFNPASDTVARVTLVDTTTTNTDMRGTDGANTTAPDNAGIAANGVSIGALNDFDPSSDTVANVTTVQTTVSNTDMRGTDGANTVTPDNVGIAANGVAIDALNDFDPSSDTVANVTTVQTTVSNTDMRGTDGANTTAPDNAGITANGVAIGNLNDITAAEVDSLITTNHGNGSYLTGTAADISTLATKDNQNVINENVKKSSKIIPASGNLPDS